MKPGFIIVQMNYFFKRFQPQNYVELRIQNATYVKSMVLWSWLRYRQAFREGRREALRPVKSLRNSGIGSRALVLGNGPSVGQLDVKALDQARRSDSGLKVFAVNYFPLSQLAEDVAVDYLVLSDPAMAPGNVIDPRAEDLWKWIVSNPQCQIVLPLHWRASLDSSSVVFNRVIWFDDSSLELISKNISPVRARGYTSMTTYKALALACWMNFKSIGLLGLDNSMFKNLAVTKSNQINQNPLHFFDYKTPGSMRNFSSIYGSVADYFFHLAKSFADLSLFKKYQIVNLGLDSYVDAFPKDETWLSRDPQQ